jgi:hypothetical protein
VQQRKRTLLNVLNVVLEAQRDYFDYGPQAMKPLPMTGVAEKLGIHVATVSRAVADKYIQTPRGVVPLRKFFTGGLATESGQDMSYDAVKAALGEVIAAEDKAAPLSDDAIVIELKKRGIEIARRDGGEVSRPAGNPHREDAQSVLVARATRPYCCGMPTTLEFKQTTLSNGLTIIAETDPAAALRARRVSSSAPAPATKSSVVMGVSHFLEHMMFKGTHRHLSAEELNRAFDEIGARNNAFTSSEMTCFYAHVLPEDSSARSNCSER